MQFLSGRIVTAAGVVVLRDFASSALVEDILWLIWDEAIARTMYPLVALAGAAST
jgi:hypothetical protein